MHSLPRDAAGLRLRGADMTPIETRAEREVVLILASVGALSAAVAALAPPTSSGLPGWIYLAIPLAPAAHAAHFKNRRARLVAT